MIKNESLDRLSPLTSAGTSFISMSGIVDQTGEELEKYIDFDLESNMIKANGVKQMILSSKMIFFYIFFLFIFQTTDHLIPQSTTHVNTRRHTVGPGDVAHEQALANPTVPINFKFGNEVGTNLPINLPMLQNQPLHNFTIKDQHLLKPPTVMGASKSFFLLFVEEGTNFLIFFVFQLEPLDEELQMVEPTYTFIILLVVVTDSIRKMLTIHRIQETAYELVKMQLNK